jgi:tetratricopeptide (TPR) repeat protein
VHELAHSDRFVVRRELGKGGMGRVYEVLDRDKNAVVALKTLQRATPRAIARFKAEFRSLAGLVHPHLVTLYDLVVTDNQVFYTMELIDGVHFDRWVRPLVEKPATRVDSSATTDETEVTRSLGRDSKPTKIKTDAGILDVRRLRRSMRQLAEGVTTIHEAGKLHRDLKPSNVMVTESGRVVILDFGLVADIEDWVERNVLEGTASYMSPEQGARARLTPASDWYTVGVILYRALTGRMPFLGGREDVLMDKQRFEPPPPSEIAPDVPADLDALCTELLRRQPQRRPSGPDILRRLGSKLADTAVPFTMSTSGEPGQGVLVGREAELAYLHQAWRDVAGGAPVVVHVSGSSGMGKTRVVQAFLDDAGRPRSALVLRGRCYESESVAFKGVDSLIDATATYLSRLEPIEVEGLMPRDAMALARVFPVLRQVAAVTSRRRREVLTPDPQELRRRAFGALRELFQRIADRGPLVLAVDDVQWGDADSAELLVALLAPPEPPPLLLVLCWRKEAAADSDFLRNLARGVARQHIAVRELDIEQLSSEDTRALAALHLGDRDDADDLAARIADEAQGSPFFVEEMARHLRDSHGDQGASLKGVLRRRLTKLPDAAARLLGTIAVAGRPIPRSVATRAASVTDPAVLSLLKAGSYVQSRTIDGARYVEAYHDRIREAAVGQLSEEELADHHLRLAHMFESSAHPDPETLAFHYAGAGENVRAAALAVEAARRANEALAFDRAAALYRAALDMSPETVVPSIWVELGDSLVEAGRGEEAAAAYDAAIPGAGKHDALDLKCRAASQLLYAGHIEAGLSRLQEVTAELGMQIAATPRRAILTFLWNRMRLAIRGMGYQERDARELPASRLMQVDVSFAVTEALAFSDPIGGADFHSRSVLLALRSGEPLRVHRAIAAEAGFASLQGVKAHKRVMRLLAQLTPLTAQIGTAPVRAMDVGVRALAAFNLARFGEAIELSAESERIYRDECRGYRFELGAAQLYNCFALALSGRVRVMLRRYPSLVGEASERGDLFVVTNLRSSMGVYVPLMQDDPDEAYRIVDDAMARWPQQGFHLPHCNAMGARAYVDMYRRAGLEAYQRIEAVWSELERSKLLLIQIMRVLSWSSRGRAALCAYRETGDRRAHAIARRASRRLTRERADYATGMALVIDAGLREIHGDSATAAALLEQSERLSDRAGVILHAKAARWARGRLIGGDEGDALMESASQVFREEGAVRPDGLARIFAPVGDY